MENTYYIITSEANKKVFCSNNFYKIADFIKKNQDARVRTVDYTGKPKIMSKELFLTKFIAFSDNKKEFFILASIMINVRTNLSAFLSQRDLLQEFNAFKKEFL